MVVSRVNRQAPDKAPEVEVRAAPSEAEERAWVEHVRRGDRAAFDALVRRYYEPLRAFARGLVGASEAPEVVQDLFWNIWRMRETWTVRTSVSSYLFNAAHKLALNVHRRARVHDRWEHGVVDRGEGPVLGSVGPSAAERVETLELETELRRAIARLAPGCQQVAILRFLFDYSCPQVAEALGITTKAAERHAATALRELRKALGPMLERR